MEAAHGMVQEARKSRCISQREKAVREQEEALACEWFLSDGGPTSNLRQFTLINRHKSKSWV